MSRGNTKAKGALALIGGRLELDNEPIFAELRRLSKGRIAILPTASGIPEEVGAEALEDFLGHGFEAEVVPVYGEYAARIAAEPGVLNTLEDYGSVYFTGGDQSRIIAALEPGGKPTPALQRIRAMYDVGGLVAGSSAGAAMMSSDIILSGTSLEALVDGITDDIDQPGLTLGKGLGFFPWGMVDQHFIKRGRIARLLVAMRTCGYAFGFGIDENTGMFVRDGVLRVLGETGLVVADLRSAAPAGESGGFDGVRISYLDSGDQLDLRRCKAIPGPGKKRLRAGLHAFSSPAPYHRNAFGSYALHDLWTRLIQGKPSSYSRDVALAYDNYHETEVVVELQRLPRRSSALSARGADGPRYTALNFVLNINCKRLGRAAWRDFQHQQVRSFFDESAVAPEARMVVVGNSPTRWNVTDTEDLLNHVAGPVGIIAAASGRADRVARDYLNWFDRHGVQAENLDVTRHNIERVCRNRRRLERIAGMRTLLLTGGDQRRLVETLLHRGRPTDVLRAIAHAYQRGARLMVVGGAASAMATSMVAEGTSCDALRYGASPDAGHEGIVIDEGLGFFDLGLIDQNLVRRRRVGRLLVACAEQGARYGFGICEESGMVLGGSVSGIHATGRQGFVVVDSGKVEVEVRGARTRMTGARLTFVATGESFDPVRGEVVEEGDVEARLRFLVSLLSGLADECQGTLVEGGQLPRGEAIAMAWQALPGGVVRFDLETSRGGGC